MTKALDPVSDGHIGTMDEKALTEADIHTKFITAVAWFSVLLGVGQPISYAPHRDRYYRG